MRRITPLLLLLTFGCGRAAPAESSPKSRANEQGEIERHLRDIRRHAPEAPSPTARREAPTETIEANAAVETSEANAAAEMSEAARAQEISATHVHEHEHVDEPVFAQRGDAQPSAALPTPPAEHATDEATPLEITLSRVVVARAITEREPVGLSPFTHDVQRLYVFIEARNAGVPTTLEVRWIAPDGTAGQPIELALPTARRWRTWATTRRVHDRPGTWTAVVRDARGEERGRSTFEVSAAPSAA